MSNFSFLSHLECGYCHEIYEADQLIGLCRECQRPLLARYDLEQAAKVLTPDILKTREANLWRYHEVLPSRKEEFAYTLGEGYTPMLAAKRLGQDLGMEQLFIKDEGLNPTTSFKARGLCLAVSRAVELGASALSIPSAGNAAGAMSAYAALAGIPAYIFMPRDVPAAFVTECENLGARVKLIDGLINDCGRVAAEQAKANDWFDLSTLKEPYRIEGKKTMGYEIAEQFNWQLPDVIIYPTGGGTGLIGMWKAFAEMQQMGWIDAKRPRMVAVQSSGCAPIITAFKQGLRHAELFANAHTLAAGLRVPAAVGDFLILDAIRESGGTAVAVSDEQLLADSKQIARSQGIFAAPEGGATLSALKHLLQENWIHPQEKVVLFNTGSGHKYVTVY